MQILFVLVEPLKISSALKSELLKLQFRKAEKQESIGPLDYTVIAALKEALEKRAQGQEVKKGAGLCRKNTDESI